MSTAHGSGGSDDSGGEMKLPQLNRSRGAHRGVFTRRATAIRQAVGALEDVQATLEFLIDRRKMLTDMKRESSVELRKLLESTNEHVQTLYALRLQTGCNTSVLAARET